MYAPSGYKVEHDPEKCELCGECAKVCNFGAIQITDSQRTFRSEACLGCELCVEACERQALTLVLEGGPILPLDMDMVKEKLG
jgi:ferredoxin